MKINNIEINNSMIDIDIKEDLPRFGEEMITKEVVSGDSTYYDCQPGDGTRYPFIITKINSAVTERLGGNKETPHVLITFERGYNGYSSYAFSAGGEWVHPSYIAEKLNIKNIYEAKIVALLIQYLLKRK